MEAHKMLLQEILTSNRILTNEICQLAGSKSVSERGQSNAVIRHFLLKLYKSIVLIGTNGGHPDIAYETIVEVWRSFMEPIHALSKLPSGNFLTARMLLYLASSFIYENAVNRNLRKNHNRASCTFLHEFCIELDDALLEPLRKIWVASNRCEEFNWVFTQYPLQRLNAERTLEEQEHCFQLALALSSSELVEMGGIQGRQFLYTQPSGSDEPNWKLFLRPTPRWDLGEECLEEFLWKEIGSDGPIRGVIHSCIIDEDQHEESWFVLDVLRRARQFCFDARQIAEPIMMQKRQTLLKQALDVHKIPLEIQFQILNHLKGRGTFPYLENLDIAKAYAPFPRFDRLCVQCGLVTGDKIEENSVKLTCPEKSLYIWNFALRMFHVFHQDISTSWWLCRHGFSCSGHHKSHGWEVGLDPDFTGVIEAHATVCNVGFSDLDRAGLGPSGQICLDSYIEDSDRRRVIFEGQGPFRDLAKDIEMHGGIGGLKSCMVHGKTLVGAWRGQDGARNSYTAPQWAMGRNLDTQAIGEGAIQDLHYPGLCEWC